MNQEIKRQEQRVKIARSLRDKFEGNLELIAEAEKQELQLDYLLFKLLVEVVGFDPRLALDMI